jgi:hypothetical protein
MSEWISVKDRLPETEQYVLAYHNSCYPRERVDFFSETSKRWMMSAGDVTHWMPLPEAPKENE